MVSPGARSLASHEMLNTNLANLAGLQEKSAPSLPRTWPCHHGTAHTETPTCAEGPRAPESSMMPEMLISGQALGGCQDMGSPWL